MVLTMTLSCPEEWQEFFESYYQDEINKIAYRIQSGEKDQTLYVDFLNDLVIYRGSKLAEELLEYPDEVLKHAQQGLLKTDNIYDVSLDGVKVRFYNLPSSRRVLIRELRAKHVSKFISIEGMVRRITSVQFKPIQLAYKCCSCGRVQYVQSNIIDQKVKKPDQCGKCGSKNFERSAENDKLIDVQYIILQESFEDLKAGESPQQLQCLLCGDLAGQLLPGQRVRLNGVLRRSEKAVYLEVNSIEKLEADDELELTKEDVEKIKELANDPKIYDRLAASIAPTISGYDDLKLAIILQLFGSERKILSDGKIVRGEIHTLLVGDPSTAKSDLLSRIKDIAHRSVYATGKGATSAGLTATATRDERTGEWTLDAGALVLADKGIAVIDEFDKMSNEDRKSIHTALEQGYIDMAKANINARLMTRCSVLAAANPKYGRFDKLAPIANQIDIDPALLTRFDLIFTIFDKTNEERDLKIAETIASNIYDNNINLEIDRDLLRKYIIYARKHVKNFKITEEAKEKAIQFYLSLRRRSTEVGILSVCTRHLEAIFRLANASARVRLSETIDVEDVERAIKLVQKSLEQIALDPETGEVDIDYAFSGTSKTQRDRILTIVKIIEKLQNASENMCASVDEILAAAEAQGISEEDCKEIIKRLKQEGRIYEPKRGLFRAIL